MRITIDIDDDLMREALKASGLPTKRAAVEEGLRVLIRLNRQDAVRSLFGQVHWVPMAVPGGVRQADVEGGVQEAEPLLTLRSQGSRLLPYGILRCGWSRGRAVIARQNASALARTTLGRR